MGENEDLFVLESEETWTVDSLLQKTPWWALSIAFHFLIMLVLWVVKFGVVARPEPPIVYEVTHVREPDEEEYIKERKKDFIRKDQLVVKPREVKAPAVDLDVPKDDHTETPNDEPFESAKGTIEGLTLDDDVPMASISGPIGIGKTPRPLGPRGPYGDRLGGKEAKTAGEGGGPEAIEAVDAGLRWLARHQSADGSWHPDTWSHECPAGDPCVGKGGGGQNAVGGDYPGAVTGFALLAFLGAGHTDTLGTFKGTVRRALEYLRRTQLENGKFEAGQGRRMYSHGIAALAAAEAYGMTNNPKWKRMAQDAIDYICYVQNPLGGWNYSSPAARNDTSISGWQLMALKSAKIAKLNVPRENIERTKRWLEIASGGDYRGDFCYTVVGTDPIKEYKIRPGSIRMRAVGCLGYYFFGMATPQDDMMRNSGDVFLKNLPSWDASGKGVDLYYWYYATLVNFQTDGKYWSSWNVAMKKALLENQQVDGHADGSWAPVDKYSNRWSRPGITALSTLCLEVYYRYRRNMRL